MFRTSPFILAAKRGGGGAKKPAFVSSGKRTSDSSLTDSSSSPLPGSSSDSTYKRGALARASSQSVLDTFLQIQLGTWSPAPQTARQVLLTHFGPKLMQMQLSEAKLAAMDPKRVTKLLKQTLYEQYLAVPFTVLSFDLEFTGIPNFSGGGGESSTKMNKSSSSSDAKKDGAGDGDEQSMLSDDLLVGEEEGDGNKSSSGDENNSMAGGGPSEDIVEIALYDPDRKKLFSQLVLPYNKHKMSDGAAMLTGITDEELQAKGKPLIEAWNAAVDFIEETMRHNVAQRMEQARAETEALNRQRESAANPFSFESAVSASNAGSTADQMKTSSNNSDFLTGDAYKNNQAERLLLLSHGARLVDIAMINWVQTLEGAKQLPPQTTTFGDTLLQIKDLHRRRPVTKDKWPAAWSLEDIATFLNLKVESTHRAGPDAKLTWEALYHSLDRYGDESLTPRQQLVGRFFDHDAKSVLNAYDVEQQQSRLAASGSSSSSSSGMFGKGTAKIGQGLNLGGKDSSSEKNDGSAGFSVL